MKLGVFGSFDQLLFDRLAAHDLVAARDAAAVSLAQVIGELEGIVIRSPFKLRAEHAAAARRLRWIIRAGAGTDNIAPAFGDSGVVVRSVPVNARSVAELAVGLCLGLMRHIGPGHAALREGRWLKSECVGTELRGRRLGILGFGRIGREVAGLGAALGLRTSAFDRTPGEPTKQRLAEQCSVRFLGLRDLLGQSDILVGCLPDNPQSRHMLDRPMLDLLPRGCILINVGRGSLVEMDALLELLESGRLGGVGLDVYPSEPPAPHPIFQHPRALCTPHVGAQTHEARRRAAAEVLRLIEELERDRPAAARRADSDVRRQEP